MTTGTDWPDAAGSPLDPAGSDLVAESANVAPGAIEQPPVENKSLHDRITELEQFVSDLTELLEKHGIRL